MHCRVAQVMRNQTTYCTVIALTFTCEAAGSQQVGEIMVSLFLEVVWCVVVVCWEMAFCACSDFVTRRWFLARI
jgi:hypothetical protein